MNEFLLILRDVVLTGVMGVIVLALVWVNASIDKRHQRREKP